MSIKILAIDDSRTIRDLLRQALELAGFTVDVAEDGVAGLEKLEDVDPDIVITDVNMPRLDGFGVISAIRASDHHSSTPILVLTTESAQELKSKARSAGATGWVVKPFDDEKLISAIRRICAV